MNMKSLNHSFGGRICQATLLAVSLAMAGCATVPNAELESARASYQAAAQDADVARYASVALYEAKKELDKADAEWAKDKDSAETSHLAGVAETRVKIARANAQTGRARADAQVLFDSREKLQLEARTSSAERARADAERARKEAEAALARASKAEQALADLQGKQTDRGLVLTLGGDVLFNVNESVVSPGARNTLDRIADFLRENPDRNVSVEGHTDSSGSDTYNLALSQRRADAVGNYLISRGIAGTRVAARGFGESVPVASNDNAAGRQQNRRVEVVILNES